MVATSGRVVLGGDVLDLGDGSYRAELSGLVLGTTRVASTLGGETLGVLSVEVVPGPAHHAATSRQVNPLKCWKANPMLEGKCHVGR